MTEKLMSVHQVASLTGITARTLHYYDQIGLFKPSVVTEAKYRLYTESDLCRLQEILFFREVGFSLKEIERLLSFPSYNRKEEVIERWGNTDSFREYEAKFPAHDRTLQNKQLSAFYIFAQKIFERLALHENSSPACDEAQQIVQEWQQYISEHFFSCDKLMLTHLGNLYVSDERFSNFINRFGNGDLASFFQKAIDIYCKKQ